MGGSIVALAVALGVSATGGLFGSGHGGGGRIMPPGPGYGWGYPNGNPDGYGWVDYGDRLPIGGDRTPDYYFRRYHALPPAQLFPLTYYNPYVNLGERYVPFAGCGGCHPLGRLQPLPTINPVMPYQTLIGNTPVVPAPAMSGRVETDDIKEPNP